MKDPTASSVRALTAFFAAFAIGGFAFAAEECVVPGGPNVDARHRAEIDGKRQQFMASALGGGFN